MIFHDYYTDVSRAEIDRFVGTRELARLVTVGGTGTPHVGLYPFVWEADAVDLHLVRSDEQVADLATHPRCALEVDEVLAVIPSYWVHSEYAGAATAYHRTVIFECTASVSEDPAVVAEQQRRLLARYQPEGGFRPLAADDPLYARVLTHLVAVRLAITAVRVKFKLGQNRPAETRRRIIAELRKRGRTTDATAADALERTLARPEP